MKNYEEMANDVLRRIGEYEAAQNHRRKTWIRTAATVCCICFAVAIGFGVFGAGFSNSSNHFLNIGRQNPADNTDLAERERNGESIGEEWNERLSELEDSDSIGWMVLEGKLYIQDGDFNGAEIEAGRYIGKAGSYRGYYKKLKEIDGVEGDVYRMKGREDALFIKLSNGSSVVLRLETGVE